MGLKNCYLTASLVIFLFSYLAVGQSIQQVTVTATGQFSSLTLKDCENSDVPLSQLPAKVQQKCSELESQNVQHGSTNNRNPYDQSGSTTPGNPNVGTAGAGNGGGNNQQSNSQAQQRVVNQNQCYQAQTLAQKCCSNPESCLRLSGAGTQGGSAMGQVVQTILGLAANMPSSISSMCGRGKTIADISSGLDLYLANQCRMAVSQCDSSCNGSPSNISTCNQYSGTETALTTQAMAGQLAAQFDQMCQQQTQSTAQNSFNNPDCSTAAEAATPFCQYKCNRPGASADPTCAGIISQMNGAPNGLTINNASGAPNNPFANNLPTTQDQQQVPPMANITPTAAGLTQTQPGGSAGQFMGFGNSLGNSNAASTAGGQQKGWNTHIMKGLASGNGYTEPTTAAGGGGSVASTASSPQHYNNILSHPFNLANYLPGGKYAKNTITVKRTPASLTGDINPVGDDIFADIDKGYYEACLKHMLYNCGPTIRAFEYRYKHQFTGTHGGFN